MNIMKRAIAAIAALAIVATTSVVVFAQPANAQTLTGRLICSAQSPSAWGVGSAYSRQQACRIALYQCAARTPAYQQCYVTRVDYEVY